MIRHLNYLLKKHPNTVAIILGCGLDDREGRTHLNHVPFVHVDFPDVIAAREELLPITAENLEIPHSILDEKWIPLVKEKFSHNDFIFILEGVSMYLSEREIKHLIDLLVRNFESFELWFDALSPKMISLKSKQKELKKNIELKWGFDKQEELQSLLGSEFTIISYNYMMQLFPKKWGGWYYVMKLLPFMEKGVKLVGVEFKKISS